MTPKSKIISDKITSLLSSLKITKGGHIDIECYPNEPIKKIRTVLQLSRKEIREFDIFLILEEAIREVLFSKYRFEDLQNKKGHIQEYLGIEEVESLNKIIVKTLMSFPLKYLVVIPFPSIDKKNNFELVITERFKIASLTKSEAEQFSAYNKDGRQPFLEALIPNRFNEGDICGILNIDGYFHDWHSTYINYEVYRYLMEVISSMIVFSIFKIPTAVEQIGNSRFRDRSHSISAYAMPCNQEKKVGIQIGFSPEFEEVIANLRMQEVSDLADSLRPIFNLFSSDGEDENRIKASLEWFLTGLINPNETFRIIQQVISIEALIGGDARQGVTEKLGNRISFLLGKNNKQRRSFEKLFKEIYKLRGDVIHGSKRNLSEDDKTLQYKITALCTCLLKTEIVNLEKSKG